MATYLKNQKKIDCYHCTACASVCPVQCIEMQKDEEKISEKKVVEEKNEMQEILETQEEKTENENEEIGEKMEDLTEI